MIQLLHKFTIFKNEHHCVQSALEGIVVDFGPDRTEHLVDAEKWRFKNERNDQIRDHLKKSRYVRYKCGGFSMQPILQPQDERTYKQITSADEDLPLKDVVLPNQQFGYLFCTYD